jgi:NAD(P)-dependent dehydrogenase (short-subunit alcohol dehydrogenase family)
MSSPVALIFGAGKNIGAHVAKTFASNGFKVAVASRSAKHNLSGDDFLQVTCDVADPSSVNEVFRSVEQKLGHPSVVVYNGKISYTPLVTIRRHSRQITC